MTNLNSTENITNLNSSNNVTLFNETFVFINETNNGSMTSGLTDVEIEIVSVPTDLPSVEEMAQFYPSSIRRRLRQLCWETMFGQEIIKLTVMDLVSSFKYILD